MALCIAMVWASGAATQYVAWRFHHSAQLGHPLPPLSPRAVPWIRALVVALSAAAVALVPMRRLRWLALPTALLAVTAWVAVTTPIYAPYRAFTWYAAFRQVPAAQPVFHEAWLLLAIAVGIASLAVVRSLRRSHVRLISTAHGSAGWGNGAELQSRDGLELGRDASGRILRYAGDGHLLTVAPTRSGKGVSCVVPNLLTYAGSALVTDVKSGELYAVTARQRSILTPDIYALDPFRTTPKRSSQHEAAFNPLDLIDLDADDALDDARLLAEMLIVPDTKPSESGFWVEEARGLITGLILFVANYPSSEPRTLLEVRRLLTLPPDPFKKLLDTMLERADDAHGLISRSAARLLQKADKERSGVISTAQSQTHFLDSPRMRAVLNRSSFRFTALKRAPTTIYVILPSDRVASYSAYVRLMIGCGLLGLYRVRGQPRQRVLFLLDEFGDLGNLAAVERAIRLAASAGATFWLLLQDLSRLRATYGESAGSFLAGTAVKQIFGTNDLATAEYVSGLLGQATVPVASENQSSGVSRGRNAQRQQGVALTASETGRKLLLPDEVMRLPARFAIVCVAGLRPLSLTRLSYLGDAEYRGTFDPNPLYASIENDRAPVEPSRSTSWVRRRRRRGPASRRV